MSQADRSSQQQHSRADGARAGERAATDRVLPEETRRLDAHLRHQFWRWGRILFVLASLFLVVQLFLTFRSVLNALLSVLLLVVFGAIAALIVYPLMRLIERARISRGFAAVLALLSGLIVLVGVALVITLPLSSQARQLSSELPRLERPFMDLQHWFAQRGINFGVGTVESVLGISVNNVDAATTIANVARVTVGVIVDLIIVLVIAFWLLRDHATLRGGTLTVLPGRWRDNVDFALKAFAVVFGGYIRGQLALALFVGALSGFGCWIIGVPFPLLVGVTAGVFELIPLAGAFVGAAVAVVFALTVSGNLAIATVGLFVFIHLVDGYLVSPRVQGRFVRLHPLLTILALLVGVKAGGFLGAFFSVPVASLIAVITRAELADLRANEPELFVAPTDAAEASRRRRLLAEYRVHPWAMLQTVRRRLARPVKG